MQHLFALALLLAGGAAAAAERVVALSPHLAEIACAAGACDKLVGKVAFSDYPAQVAALPSVGDAFNLNLERLLSLRPTLILTWEGGGAQQSASRLRQLGLRVEPVSVRRLDEIALAMRKIGGWLGTQKTANAAAEALLQGLQQLRVRYANVRRLRVFYQVQIEPLFTISGASPISEALAVCGGDNVFSSLGPLAAPVSLEALFAADPDVVIYAEQDLNAAQDYWRKHSQLSAVKAGRWYAVNADRLARSTPRMLEGIRQLCGALDRARADLAEQSN